MQAGIKAGESLIGLDELLSGSEGALSQLRQAARRIERGAADHPLLGEALAALDRALIEANEAEDRITRAADALAFDPERLELVEARLFDIRGLARKHRVEPDALAALGEQMRAQLAAIDAGGERMEELDRQLAAARERYSAAAGRLSEARHRAAAQLDTAVASELAPLKLDAARFRTSIAAAEAGPSGTDRIEFEVSTNPGAPFGPLTRIASGGELSRFILALKVALAEAGTAATMIFDEVDRGVGGAVASAIGERLARLAHEFAGAGRHSFPAGRRARFSSLPDREEPWLRRHTDHGPKAFGRGAARRDRANAFGRVDHRGGAGAGVAPARRRMSDYIALLRGVNLLGASTLRMTDLKSIAEELGLERVRTYIASGNLLFQSSGSEEELRLMLQERLLRHMGRDVRVMLRTVEELEAVVAIEPVPGSEGKSCPGLLPQ